MQKADWKAQVFRILKKEICVWDERFLRRAGRCIIYQQDGRSVLRLRMYIWNKNTVIPPPGVGLSLEARFSEEMRGKR